MKKETREIREIDELLKLLIHSRTRLSELLDVCTTQRGAGELRVFQQTTLQAERLLYEIRALEEILEPRVPDGLMFANSTAPTATPTAPTR